MLNYTEKETKKEIKPNAKQQECIDNLKGQYLVLAGPGTGKTFTIVQRIKAMLNNKIDPNKILCLTFTESAANEMKKRIDFELNKIDSGIVVSTYHSFCKTVIDNNPDVFQLDDNIKLINEAVSKEFLKECIDDDTINSEIIRGDSKKPYSCISNIKKVIDEIKQNKLTKEKFEKNLKENPDWILELKRLEELEKECIEKDKLKAQGIKTGRYRNPLNVRNDIEKQIQKIEKVKEIWKVFELYQEKMIKFNYIDFNDMINLVLEQFEKDPSFLELIANEYEYIIVDEYQDTNPPQNAVVINLAKAQNSKNIFVVGDDDQIIYTFQGAKLDTMEKFLEEFPKTKVICLTENMRSTQSILDISRKIALQDNNRLETNAKFKKYEITKELLAKNEEIILKDKKIELIKYIDETDEKYRIANDIFQLINSPDCPKDKNGNINLSGIAILTRGNKELNEYAQILKNYGIPIELKDGKDIFNIKSSLVLYYYLSTLVNPQLYSDRLFKIMLLKPFQINSKDYETLYMNKSNSKAFIDCLRNFEQMNLLEPNKIEKFIKVYDYLKDYSQKESLKNIILETGSKTGIFDYYLNDTSYGQTNKAENIAGIKKLIDEAADFSLIKKTLLLSDFITYLDMVFDDDDLDIKTDKAPYPLNAVQLSTYHSSKGREFEYVYMPSLFNTKWESEKTNKSQIPLDIKDYKDKDELKQQKISDCIRLMFVAFTRAKHTLKLSYYESTGTKHLTEFVENIKDNLECKIKDTKEDADSYWERIKQIAIKKDYDYKKEFTSLIDLKLKDMKFSASSINLYLKCPRQFFYDKILDLAPKAANPNSLSFGTAIHKGFEEAVKYAIENKTYPNKDFIIYEFKKELKKLPIADFEQRKFFISRGIKTIDKYYQYLINTSIESLYQVEKNIELSIDGIDFTGFIDRLDKNQDGTYTIYDYKTGSAKSEKSISVEGEYENYYNQIAFYKYMFEAHSKEQNKNEKIKETVFIFPEEPEKNVVLNLTDNDCLIVKDKYVNAVKSIYQHNFDSIEIKKKEEAPCKYCAFRNYCDFEVV